MRHRRAALLAAAVALAIPRNARADEGALHFAEPPTITSAGGTVLTLPPGYYLSDPQFAALDAELRRAQDAETRLRAENDSLRASAARASAGPSWRVWGLAVTAAFVGGMLAGARASR